jgi:hypothetical protein
MNNIAIKINKANFIGKVEAVLAVIGVGVTPIRLFTRKLVLKKRKITVI